VDRVIARQQAHHGNDTPLRRVAAGEARVACFEFHHVLRQLPLQECGSVATTHTEYAQVIESAIS